MRKPKTYIPVKKGLPVVIATVKVLDLSDARACAELYLKR